MHSRILHSAEMQPNDRLRIARLKAGFESAADAARRLGVSYGTYAGHENGNRGMKMEELQRYSSAFGMPLNWLAFGDDPRGPAINVLGLIDNFGAIKEFRGQDLYRRTAIDPAFNRVFVSMLANDDYSAYIVMDMPKGSMIENDDLVVVSKSRFLGSQFPDGQAIIRLIDGRLFFREVKQERPFQTYSLYMPERPAIGGVTLKDYFKVVAIVRDYEPDSSRERPSHR